VKQKANTPAQVLILGRGAVQELLEEKCRRFTVWRDQDSIRPSIEGVGNLPLEMLNGIRGKSVAYTLSNQ
jgi:hypothetical protein